MRAPLVAGVKVAALMVQGVPAAIELTHVLDWVKCRHWPP